MDNTPEREKLIAEMIQISQMDAPWVWGFHPQLYTLRQGWVAPFKPNAMSRNTLKYMALDPHKRTLSRIAWNQYELWPLLVGVLILLVLCIPAVIIFYRSKYQPLQLKKARALEEPKP